jgi:hypothetical protein
MSRLNRRSAAPVAAVPLVVVHEHLIAVSRRQIEASPCAETGGKFLGFIISPGSQPSDTTYGRAVAGVWRKLAAGDGALLLVGSISPGPRVKSTKVELFPDAEFQGSVFQALEADEPALHHLGSRHSHHPNGMPHFSPGDLAHYRSVMESENYEPDYFVAGLCVDARGLLPGGIFEVFGRDGFRQALPTDLVKTLTGHPSLQTVVDATERVIAARLAGTSSGTGDRMAAALSKRFTIQGRDEDDEAISWIIADRAGLGFQGVVTWAKGTGGPVEVALEISRKNGKLRYEGPISGDQRALADPLWKLMKELDGAKRAADRQR